MSSASGRAEARRSSSQSEGTGWRLARELLRAAADTDDDVVMLMLLKGCARTFEELAASHQQRGRVDEQGRLRGYARRRALLVTPLAPPSTTRRVAPEAAPLHPTAGRSRGDDRPVAAADADGVGVVTLLDFLAPEERSPSPPEGMPPR